MKDYFGNPLDIGNEILYIGVLGHSPDFKEGKILVIDENHDDGYGNKTPMVKVLGNNNTKAGWTYPDRIINKKYVLVVNANNTDSIDQFDQALKTIEGLNIHKEINDKIINLAIKPLEQWYPGWGENKLR
jgi:hypothetical protein